MAKFGVKEVADFTFFELNSDGSTGNPVLFLDTLKMSTIENTADDASARGGKGNPELLMWNFNRSATVQIQDALMSPRSINLLTGNSITSPAATPIHKREVLVVNASNKITLTETPLTTNTQYPVHMYKLTNGSDETKIESTNYSVAVKEVTFTSGATNGDYVIAYYGYTSANTALTLSVNTDKFPGYYRAVGDTVVRNANSGTDEPFQIVIPKAKLQPGFTMTFSADGDPAAFDMNLKVFREPGVGTGMIYMKKY